MAERLGDFPICQFLLKTTVFSLFHLKSGTLWHIVLLNATWTKRGKFGEIRFKRGKNGEGFGMPIRPAFSRTLTMSHVPLTECSDNIA